MSDPLAQFRKRLDKEPAPEKSAAASPDGREVYEAFRAVDREPKRLQIRPSIQPWVRATYSYLQYIAEDNGRGTRFNLVFGFLVVVIRGRNLGNIISAIDSENCAFIEEFDPSRHSRPGPNDAMVESIVYHMDKEKRAEVLGDVQGVAPASGKRKVENA